MLLRPWAGLLSGFCGLFAWCMTLRCCVLQTLCVVLTPVLVKEMSLRAYWCCLGMWKIEARTWWVCSSYLVATGSTVLHFSLLCTVRACSAPCHTSAMVWYLFVLCNAQSGWHSVLPLLALGCCEHPSALHPHVLCESPLSPHCPLLSSGLPNFISSSTALTSPQIQPCPFSEFSFVHAGHCHHKGDFLPVALWACWLLSLGNSHCRPGVHRGRKQSGRWCSSVPVTLHGL